MASGNVPANLPESQSQSVMALRLAAQLAALVLLGLAGVKIVTSILLILDTTLVALLGVVEGALTAYLALILIKITTDLRYAREVPELGAIHLLNAFDSWRDFCKTLIAAAVVALLAALARHA